MATEKLSMAQVKVLKVLDTMQPMTAAEVARKTKSRAGPMTRSLLVLEGLEFAKPTRENTAWKRTGKGSRALKKMAI